VWGAVVRLPKTESDPEPEIRLISPEELDALLSVFLAVNRFWDWEQARRRSEPSAPQPVLPPATGAEWWQP
jgi:hypothetical protein